MKTIYKPLLILSLISIYFIAILPILESYTTKLNEITRYSLDGIIFSTIIVSITAIAVRFTLKNNNISGAMLLFAGKILLLKPFLAPVKSRWPIDSSEQYIETSHPFSITSETHLYFLIPGFILIILYIVTSLRDAPGRNRP
jgi:hypothetical protein